MLLINAQVYDKNFELQDWDLRILDGKISEIAERGQLDADVDEDIVNLAGKRLAPGMIDIHTHGALGRDTMDGDAESIEIISRHLASNGVTSFLPTTMTMGEEHITKTFTNVPETTSGANILGFHMEGPFINVEKKGAQNAEYIRFATVEEVEKYQDLVDVKIIDIAPEFSENLEFIKAKSSEINIQVGHCMATYEDTVNAMDAGATGLCHGFNAMPSVHHRKPGPIIGSLIKGQYTEIIADGLHLHPAIVVAAYNMFGPERMIIISDAIKTTGLEDGEYIFGGQAVVMKEGVTRMKDSGAIAGGTSNVWEEVKNCITWGIPEADAFRMGSLTAAEYINVADSKGSIEIGKDADLVVSNSDYDVLDVYIAGVKFV